jgi:hypothetical protein
MPTPTIPMNRAGAIVQRMIECQVVGKRFDSENMRWEYLAEWTGLAGDTHSAWYSETVIKLGD